MRWPIHLAELLVVQALSAPMAHAIGQDGVAMFHAPPVGALPSGDSRDPGPVAAVPDAVELYLEVHLNGAPRGLALFFDRDGVLWSSPQTLESIGLRLPEELPDPVKLDAIPGVAVRYDGSTQAVALTVPPDLLALESTVLGPGQTSPPVPETSPGMVLNYDLYATWPEHGEPGLNALTRWRAFGRAGVLETSYLSYFGGGSRRGWRGESARLETTYTRSFADRMLSLRVGDVVSGGVSWSRPVRMGGVQLARDFSLQPYRITTPMPQFMGSAALPSAVELYVNGIQQYAGELPAGPFELNAPPSITGAGTAQVVLTDALGRISTLDFPIYAAHDLLQAGLSDWSIELGQLRRGYGLGDDGYTPGLVGSGTLRRGVRPWLTLEAHGEGGRGVRAGGVGAVVALGRWGVVDGAIAWGSHGDTRGRQVSAGYRWDSSRLHFSLQGTRAADGYRDLASLDPASRRIRETGQALVGLNDTRLGSIGINYTHLRYDAQPRSRYAGVYWSRPFGSRVTAGLRASQNLDDGDDQLLSFNLTVRLDGNVSLGAGWQHDRADNGGTLSATHWPSGDDRSGWRAQLRDSGSGVDGSAEATWRGLYADLSAGIQANDETRLGHVGATGAVVLMGGRPFLARRIDDGFAVVSTSGFAGIPVSVENHPVGVTDEDGLLLVTPLRAYERNSITIDPMDLPADVRVGRSQANATPADRAGAMVQFAIAPVRAALLTLHGPDGQPLEVGTPVRLASGDETAVVGFDGEVYLEQLGPGINGVHAQSGGRVCGAHFDYPDDDGPLPRIGPLTCAPEEQP